MGWGFSKRRGVGRKGGSVRRKSVFLGFRRDDVPAILKTQSVLKTWASKG